MAAPLGLVASGMLAQRASDRQLGQRDRAIGLQERRLGLDEQQMQVDAQAKQRAAVQKNASETIQLVDTLVRQAMQKASANGADPQQAVQSVLQDPTVASLLDRVSQFARLDETVQAMAGAARVGWQNMMTPDEERQLKAADAGAVAGAQAEARAPFARPPVTNVNVTNMGEIETAGQKELAKLSGQRVAEIRAAAGAADKNLVQIRRARQLLERVNPGQLAGVELVIKRFLKASGFDLEALGLNDNTGPAEALQSLGVDFALQRVQETKGAVSDAEMALYIQAAAGLSRTREGNLLILELGEKLAQRAQEAARVVNRHLSAGGSITEVDAVIQDYFDNNPLMTTDAVQNRINQALEAPTVASPNQSGGPMFNAAPSVVTAADIRRTAEETGQSPAAVARALRRRGVEMTREAAAIEVAE